MFVIKLFLWLLCLSILGLAKFTALLQMVIDVINVIYAQFIIFALHSNFIVDFINLGLAKSLWPQAAVCVSAHFILAFHLTLGFTSFGGPTSIRLKVQ